MTQLTIKWVQLRWLPTSKNLSGLAVSEFLACHGPGGPGDSTAGRVAMGPVDNRSDMVVQGPDNGLGIWSPATRGGNQKC